MEFAGEKLGAPWSRTIADDEDVIAAFDLMETRIFARRAERRREEREAREEEMTADGRPIDLPPVR